MPYFLSEDFCDVMVRQILHNYNKIIGSRENKRLAFFSTILVFTAFIFFPQSVNAGQYFLGPATGTFSVGSTFDVQIFLDTNGESVNALDVDIRFPADKLQLVSPKTSVSVIEVWTSQPKFNNSEGTVRLQGGIPRGINVDNALVATLTFRVKSVGNAIIRFGDNSKILLNDGLGTNDLRKKGDGVYVLTLPPPAGPVVASETHPVQGKWYTNPNVILRWTLGDNVESYSYILDNSPVTVPDDTPDGKQESVVYKDLSEGQYYFHIKALRGGVWGGVTHFALNIDTVPPAKFPIEVIPSARTSVKDPVIKFATSDTLSGVDHFELKIVPLRPSESKLDSNTDKSGDQNFFIEVESPYVSSELSNGPYDIIMRAVDKAGNIQEVTERMVITRGFFGWSANEGLILGSWLIGWVWLITLLLILIICAAYVAYKVKRKHEEVEKRQVNKELPENVRKQLEELRRYKTKYGATAVILLIMMAGVLFSSTKTLLAQNETNGVVELSPPHVTTVSKDVSNNEIFYVGGKTENKDTTVIIYTQNLDSGETKSFEVVSNKKGEWFYRHNSFLSPGKYVIWTQSKFGEIVSPPSAQIEMSVSRAALTFGVTRISYEVLFGLFTVILLLLLIILLSYVVYHAHHQRKKHIVLTREIREAEESIKRGFAVLRRDLEIELQNIRKAKLSNMDIEELKFKEDELFRDLKEVESRIGKEVWDIEKIERA